MLNKKNEYINYDEHFELLKRFSGCENKYITYYLKIREINPNDYDARFNIREKNGEQIIDISLDYETSLYIYWLESVKQPRHRFIFGDSLLDSSDESIRSALRCLHCGNDTYYLQYFKHSSGMYRCRYCPCCGDYMPISPDFRNIDEPEKCFKKTKKYVERTQNEVCTRYRNTLPALRWYANGHRVECMGGDKKC